LRNSDGPHSIYPLTLLNGNASPMPVYQVQLSQDFCDRFTVPNYGTIKLEKAVKAAGVPSNEYRVILNNFHC